MKNSDVQSVRKLLL